MRSRRGSKSVTDQTANDGTSYLRPPRGLRSGVAVGRRMTDQGVQSARGDNSETHASRGTPARVEKMSQHA